MRKIVILTNSPDEKALLISWLEILFPECEIEIRRGQEEKVETLHTLPEYEACHVTPSLGGSLDMESGCNMERVEGG